MTSPFATSFATPSPAAYAYPLLVKQLLHAAAATAGTQEIVYRDTHRFTYAGFIERLGRLANALRSLDVGEGGTVAVMDWDSHRYLEAFFAVPMMGAVLQTVNIRLAPEQILYTLNHAGAEVVLVHADFVPVLAGIAGQLTSVKHIVLIGDGEPAPSCALQFDGEYEGLLANAQASYDFPDFDENTRATTFYTTGTTGLPKGVFFSHRQLVLHALAVAAAFGTAPRQGGLGRGDVYMPITPMFHAHAWGFPYIATMLGLKQVYPGRYAPDALLGYIENEGVTFTHGVPTILHMLLSAEASAGVDLSRCKMLIGGSALPKGLALAAMARGLDVFTGYGLSETGPILTVAHLRADFDGDAQEEAAQRVRTGAPIPLVDVRVVDEDMRALPHDGASVGEVVARAPWLTQGYLGNPDASASLWAGGYMHTGDLGTIDPVGTLQVSDRLKDVIKSGGEWVSSLELESILSEHPAVAEVAVVGVKDAKWGERPLALVVLKPGAQAGVDELRAQVAAHAEQGRISKYAIPNEVRFVAAIPRTSVGKINKKDIRAAIAGQDGGTD
jgi:fatty-acyl-CoA synthase